MNFANPPRIVKIIAMVRVAAFLTHGVDAARPFVTKQKQYPVQAQDPRFVQNIFEAPGVAFKSSVQLIN